MATVNKTLDEDYALIIQAAATWFTISTRYPASVEFVTTDDDTTEPDSSIEGHMIFADEDGPRGINRSLLAEGSVWGRVINRGIPGKTSKISVDSDAIAP